MARTITQRMWCDPQKRAKIRRLGRGNFRCDRVEREILQRGVDSAPGIDLGNRLADGLDKQQFRGAVVLPLLGRRIIIRQGQPKAEPLKVEMGSLAADPRRNLDHRLVFPAVASVMRTVSTVVRIVVCVIAIMVMAGVVSPLMGVMDGRRCKAPCQHCGRHQQVHRCSWETFCHRDLSQTTRCFCEIGEPTLPWSGVVHYEIRADTRQTTPAEAHSSWIIGKSPPASLRRFTARFAGSNTSLLASQDARCDARGAATPPRAVEPVTCCAWTTRSRLANTSLTSGLSRPSVSNQLSAAEDRNAAIRRVLRFHRGPSAR